MTKPITPDEVVASKAKVVIPDYVIESFNFLISKNYRKGSSTVPQKDVIDRIIFAGRRREYETPITVEYLFDNHFLDVEDIYREAGWEVVYDKPAYCETYEATFKFTKKAKHDD